MITKVAEYTVKDSELKVVKEAITTFLTAIREHEPETRYEAWQRGESLEFVHVMQFQTAAAERQHQTAPYTREFVTVLYPRCDIEPRFTDLVPIE